MKLTGCTAKSGWQLGRDLQHPHILRGKHEEKPDGWPSKRLYLYFLWYVMLSLINTFLFAYHSWRDRLGLCHWLYFVLLMKFLKLTQTALVLKSYHLTFTWSLLLIRWVTLLVSRYIEHTQHSLTSDWGVCSVRPILRHTSCYILLEHPRSCCPASNNTAHSSKSPESVYQEVYSL